MATLELIHFVPHRIVVSNTEEVIRTPDRALGPIKGLPQVFWADGSSWRAANLWAFIRATNGKTDIKTVRSNLSHLHKYADWLEEQQLDWQHFPMLERERVLVRWRKHLIEQRDKFGLLAPSTATHRMSATVQFYRFAQAVTDRRNGASDVRRNGASAGGLNGRPEGVAGRGYFEAFAGAVRVGLTTCLGAR